MSGFRSFILRGNVVDLAVGFVVGAAFASVVTAFVAAFLTPLIGLVTGAAGDFSEATFDVGDVVFPYGQFVQALLAFLLIAAVVYFAVVAPVNRLLERYRTEPEVETPTVECPQCLSKIPEGARRCAFCSSEVPEMQAPPAPA